MRVRVQSPSGVCTWPTRTRNLPPYFSTVPGTCFPYSSNPAGSVTPSSTRKYAGMRQSPRRVWPTPNEVDARVGGDVDRTSATRHTLAGTVELHRLAAQGRIRWPALHQSQEHGRARVRLHLSIGRRCFIHVGEDHGRRPHELIHSVRGRL